MQPHNEVRPLDKKVEPLVTNGMSRGNTLISTPYITKRLTYNFHNNY